MAIFITGHDRSGTTLLQRVCNSHPQILLTNEFNVFIPLGRSFRAYAVHMLRHALHINNRYRFNQQYRFLGNARFSNFPFTISYLITLLKNHQQKIGVSDIERTMKTMNPQAKIVGDKKTIYNSNLQILLKNEGLKGVVIYRDCRDVTGSFLQMARTVWATQPWIKNLRTADAIAQRWVKWIDLMEKYASDLFIIRYENLVSDPEKELGALANDLGISSAGFHPNNINSRSIGNYRKGLTKQELNQVLAIAGPTLARLEYI